MKYVFLVLIEQMIAANHVVYVGYHVSYMSITLYGLITIIHLFLLWDGVVLKVVLPSLYYPIWNDI
jgi:hypothetical protein